MRAKDGKIISEFTKATTPCEFTQSPTFPPQLLCSGAVLRYQFKPYPKPDRSYRTSVKLVTMLEPKGIERGPEYTIPKGGKGGSND